MAFGLPFGHLETAHGPTLEKSTSLRVPTLKLLIFRPCTLVIPVRSMVLEKLEPYRQTTAHTTSQLEQTLPDAVSVKQTALVTAWISTKPSEVCTRWNGRPLPFRFGSGPEIISHRMSLRARRTQAPGERLTPTLPEVVTSIKTSRIIRSFLTPRFAVSSTLSSIDVFPLPSTFKEKLALPGKS